MRAIVKRSLLAVLPLAGVLLFTAPASAHDDYRHYNWEHDKFDDLHREYHQHPYSKKQHQRFHKWLNQDYRDSQRARYRGYRGYDDNRWYYSRRSYDNDCSRSRYYGPTYYGQQRWSSFRYR
jgi:hypothetical protein